MSRCRRSGPTPGAPGATSRAAPRAARRPPPPGRRRRGSRAARRSGARPRPPPRPTLPRSIPPIANQGRSPPRRGRVPHVVEAGRRAARLGRRLPHRADAQLVRLGPQRRVELRRASESIGRSARRGPTCSRASATGSVVLARRARRRRLPRAPARAGRSARTARRARRRARGSARPRAVSRRREASLSRSCTMSTPPRRAARDELGRHGLHDEVQPGPAADARARRRPTSQPVGLARRRRQVDRAAGPLDLAAVGLVPALQRAELRAAACRTRSTSARLKNAELELAGGRDQQVLQLALHAPVLQRDRVGLLEVARALSSAAARAARSRSSRTPSGRPACGRRRSCAALPHGSACRAPWSAATASRSSRCPRPGTGSPARARKSYGWCA